MASACVNSSVGISTASFLDSPVAKRPPYGWLNSRISSGRDSPDGDPTKPDASSEFYCVKNRTESDNVDPGKPENPDLDFAGKEFEFRLEDPVSMLPADELFSDGKIVPLQLSAIRQSTALTAASADVTPAESPKFLSRDEKSSMDYYLFSPKPPSCSIRWKELLGLKKLQQNSNAKTDHKTASSFSSHSRSKTSTRNLKHFLQRGSNSKSALCASIDSSLSLPLLQELDNEALSISSRLSLSSASLGHEHDGLSRLSLDSDKPVTIPRSASHANTSNLSKVRVIKYRAGLAPEKPTVPPRACRNPASRTAESTVPPLGVSVDSPRMNPSGKIVFHGLERSSSSPSSFNGGPRYKHRGMERSYSANVRVSPVLNVPVCSIRVSSKSGVFGFPLFSSTQKKGHHQHHPSNNRSRLTEQISR